MLVVWCELKWRNRPILPSMASPANPALKHPGGLSSIRELTPDTNTTLGGFHLLFADRKWGSETKQTGQEVQLIPGLDPELSGPRGGRGGGGEENNGRAVVSDRRCVSPLLEDLCVICAL